MSLVRCVYLWNPALLISQDANRLAQSVKEAYLAGAAGIDEEELKERVEEAATRQVHGI